MLSVCRKVTEPIQIYTAAGDFRRSVLFSPIFLREYWWLRKRKFSHHNCPAFPWPRGAPKALRMGGLFVFSNGAGTLYGICLERTEGPDDSAALRQAHLASVLRQLIARGNSGGYDGNCLKKRFYSKKELEADRKAAAEKKEQEQMLQKQQEFLKRKEKLEQIYNGSADVFGSICRQVLLQRR